MLNATVINKSMWVIFILMLIAKAIAQAIHTVHIIHVQYMHLVWQK